MQNPVKLEIFLEGAIVEKLKVMAKYKECDESEIVNKAMKKFISQHKDYFPGSDLVEEE